jgi:ribosome-binding protein aMBF1 (putative translation factor)
MNDPSETREIRKVRNQEVAAKLGATVRLRREKMVMTLAQLAARAEGLDPSLLAKMERGEAGEKTPVAVWIDLARALGWTMGDLIRAARLHRRR